MRLLAISDLHVNHRGQLAHLEALPAHPEDWLIVAGDVAERPEHLARTWEILVPRFARVLWVPGNHELWSLDPEDPRGVARYLQHVAVCRDFGVATPEDPWPVWAGPGGPATIALLFLGIDYTMRPDEVPDDGVLAWARASGIRARDEDLLHADPYESRAAWCAARCAAAEARLAALSPGAPPVLVNHWPLRMDLVRIPRIPRYMPWCGTRRTEDWHRRFGARACVHGHLHVRATDWRDGVRFEEVALGYPRHWDPTRGVEGYLREILPGPPPGDGEGPTWRP